MSSSRKTLLITSLFLLMSGFLLSTGGRCPASESPIYPESVMKPPTSVLAVDGNESELFAETSKVEDAPDPLEGMNRVIFQFNDKVYFWFLKPLSQVYGTFIPPGLRTCIRNGFDNLRFPSRFLNNVLQGKFKAAGIETGRFLINSTFGFAGFFEIAARDFCLPRPADEDTGQTLAFYGMKPFLYIMLPILGPSTLRDSMGLAGDTFLNPLYYLPQDLWVSVAIRTGIIVNNTSLRLGEYEDFKNAALDPYASMRQAYLQYRRSEILK
jgi:phospholipid-binding lipoprotein MlaA